MADDIAPEATEVDLAPPVPKAKNRRVALAVGALAVVAGGVFAAISLAGETNGPEDPVRAMFAAAEQGDVLGVLAQLDPGERDALQEPLTDLVDQLNRLDVLADADLGHVDGVDLEVDDLSLTSTVVRDDVARVTIDGGRASTTVDVSKLPLGGFIRDLAGDGLDESKPDTSTSKLDTDGDFVTTVKRGDRWYVSIGYSVAELARRDAGVSFAEMGAGVAAKGTDSPEEAVRQLVEAGTKLDVRRIIELLPPGELGALHDYAGLFIDEAERAKADVGDYTATVSKLDLDSEVDGDHGLVFVRDAAFDVKAGEVSARYADGCADITQPPTIFGDPTDTAPKSTHVCQGANPLDALKSLGLDGVDPPKLSFEGKQPKVGIAVTRVDGKWYVSPTRTLLGSLAASLEIFQPRDLEELVSYVQEVFTTTMERTFSSFETSTGVTRGEVGSDPSVFDELCADGPSADFPQEAYDMFCADAPEGVPTTTTAPTG